MTAVVKAGREAMSPAGGETPGPPPFGWHPRGRGNDAHDRALAILEAANEHPSAFRVTSRYVVAIGRRALRRRAAR